MKLLSLDPSSTITGYAFFDNGRLKEFGRIRPKSPKDFWLDRVAVMIGELGGLLAECKPDICVMESPEGLIHAKKRMSIGRGQSTYGFACGAIWQACRMQIRCVVPVPVNEWTRGISKQNRAVKIAAKYDSYEIENDKGLDIADAIGLGEFYIIKKKFENLKKM